MAKARMDITVARRMMALKARRLDHRVKIGNSKDSIKMIDAELKTLAPKKRREDPLP